MNSFCEICEDGEDCVYCPLSGKVKVDNLWVNEEILFDPRVSTPD